MKVQKFMATERNIQNPKKLIDKIDKDSKFCCGEAISVQEKRTNHNRIYIGN